MENERKFRYLHADEIDCRVATANSQSGVSLLLYKDARADMIILDETVGAENWQRRHTKDNANCVVSIWDPTKAQWIEKEDTGTESNTEKEKGLASDSFKRACVNWGIGRELYSAPFIWISADKVEWKEKSGKAYPVSRFKVSAIGYDDKGRINVLEIKNDKGTVVYKLGQQSEKPAKAQKITAAVKKAIEELVSATSTDLSKLLAHYQASELKELTAEQGKNCLALLKKKAGVE